ncbi:MAG: hypothetical protein M1830_000123 [Pleopsidium flavum]|nr:MAG: hypothetical protein M1830_000123 [Pleopsidium flavum]
MPASRRKNLIASRRRVEDEGEEEEGSMPAELEDDSLSEGSGISDADDDADAEGSDATDVDDSGLREVVQSNAKVNGHPTADKGSGEPKPNRTEKAPVTASMADTEAMMNGLKISDDADGAEEVHFEDMVEDAELPPPQQPEMQSPVVAERRETLAERRRREHEEYRKKRDADPAFVPNRGGFFMHDHRSAAPGQNGFRPFGKGRGRGRGFIGGPFSPANHIPQTAEPTDAPWAHDLHDTVSKARTVVAQSSAVLQTSKPLPFAPKSAPPNRSFSRSTCIGNVQIRIYLAGMPDPVTFSAVPVNQHTRLPHHRPPLRRDKPVRISLPDQPPRYIFPAIDRSFIFIPRALRPNQQGFGRGRGRGSYGAYGGFSSRKTSAYGGSNYSPSVTMSRRSSLAREVSREGIVSPAGSSISRPAGAPIELGKPVVRLPPGSQQGVETSPALEEIISSDQVAPITTLPQSQSYPLPQRPTFRENRPVPIPMHQPRPQKAVSVADIESPAGLTFHPPQQQQQQPFHQQVPHQVNSHIHAQDLSMYPSHSRHPSHPSQASTGTPLSQIPERAIHAQPFQPFPYLQPQGYYAQQYPAPAVYFYPPASGGSPSFSPTAASTVAAPAYLPSLQQYPVVVPIAPTTADPAGQAGTVAHESNGMVYYYDASQLSATAGTTNGYPVAGYTVPQPGGVVGMGGMMTPPDGYYYPQPQGGVYYPSQ